MNIAVILAGGSGSRLGNDVPKQFLKVAGKQVIWSTTTNQQLTSNRKLLIFYAINLLYHNFAVVENVYALLCRLVLQVLTVQSKVFFI